MCIFLHPDTSNTNCLRIITESPETEERKELCLYLVPFLVCGHREELISDLNLWSHVCLLKHDHPPKHTQTHTGRQTEGRVRKRETDYTRSHLHSVCLG